MVHKGAELIMVSLGLVQIELNEETPVMRAGDALLVTRDAIAGVAESPSGTGPVVLDRPGLRDTPAYSRR